MLTKCWLEKEAREIIDVELQDGCPRLVGGFLVLSRRPMNPCSHQWGTIWTKTNGSLDLYLGHEKQD